MFRKIKNVASTPYPDGDLILNGYGYESSNAFNIIEQLSNSDLFNTEVLNRTFKNIYENDNETSSFVNSIAEQELYRYSGILKLNKYRVGETYIDASFHIKQSDFYSNDVATDKIGGLATYSYLRIPTGILYSTNTDNRKKIIYIRPFIRLLERQITYALSLNKVVNINNNTVRDDIVTEGVEIKYSDTEEKFLCKITKIINNHFKHTVYFGCNETQWNSNTFTQSTHSHSFSLIVAINAYSDSYVNFVSDLYAACSGDFTQFRCEQYIETTEFVNNTLLYFDYTDQIIKATSLELTTDVLPIALITNNTGVYTIIDKRFLISSSFDTALKRVPLIDLTIVKDLMFNNGTSTDYDYTAADCTIEEFYSGTYNRLGYTSTAGAGTISIAKKTAVTSLNISRYLSICFNIYIPEGSVGSSLLRIPKITGGSEVGYTTIELYDEIDGSFALYGDSIDTTSNIFIFCDNEYIGGSPYLANNAYPFAIKRIQAGYHNIYITGDFDLNEAPISTSPILFYLATTGMKINDIVIYENSSITNPENISYTPNMANEIRSLYLMNDQVLKQNEVLTNMIVDNLYINTTELNFAEVPKVYKDIKNGFIVSPKVNERNLHISRGIYSTYNYEVGSVFFNNEYEAKAEIDYGKRGASASNWVSIKNSKDGKYIIACSGSTNYSNVNEDLIDGYIYISNNYGSSFTLQNVIGLGTWKSVYCSNDGKIMVACRRSSVSPIYISTDYGTTWVGRTFGGAAVKNCSSVYCNYDGSLIVVCVNNNLLDGLGFIWTSSDYGATWTQRTTIESLWSCVTGDDNSKLLVASVYNGNIWVSTNQGVTWTEKFGLSYKTWVGLCVTNNLKIYAVDDTNLYISEDAGTTWEMKTSVINPRTISCSNNGKYILAGSGYSSTYLNNLFISRDHGKFFAPVSCVGTKGWSSSSISGNGEYIVACENYSDGIYSSQDYGYDFQEISYVTNPSIKMGSMFYNDVGTKLIVSGGNYSKQGIFISQDSGSTWSSDNTFLDDNWLIAGDYTGTNLMIASTSYNYIYTSSDSGTTWVKRTSVQKQYSCIASDSDGSFLVACEKGGYIHTSNDYGVTWTEQLGSGKMNWSSVSCNGDGTFILVSVTDGFLYRSINSGVTWTLSYNSGGSKVWRSTTVNGDGYSMVACAYGDYVYLSNNAGATWEQLISLGLKNWNSVSSNSTGLEVVAVPDGEGNFYYSVTGGGSWTTIDCENNGYNINTSYMSSNGTRVLLGSTANNKILLFNVNLIKLFIEKKKNYNNLVSSDDGAVIFATTNTGYIYRSKNSGKNWKELRNCGTREWKKIVCSSLGNIVAAISDNLYISRDSGETWTYSGNSKREFKSIDMSSTGKNIIAITDEYLYYSNDYGINWVSRAIEPNGDNFGCSTSEDGQYMAYLVM